MKFNTGICQIYMQIMEKTVIQTLLTFPSMILYLACSKIHKYSTVSAILNNKTSEIGHYKQSFYFSRYFKCILPFLYIFFLTFEPA